VHGLAHFLAVIAVATGVEQIVGAVITAIAASFIGVGLLTTATSNSPGCSLLR
jgi:hypothetical protein